MARRPRPAQPSYPFAWNVNEPAGETKYDRAASAQGPGRRGPGRWGGSPCMSIIPGEELFSGVVTSEPHFSSLPFFLFLFFWRRKRSGRGVSRSETWRLPGTTPPGAPRSLGGAPGPAFEQVPSGASPVRNQSPAEGGFWGWDKPPVLVLAGSPPTLGGPAGGQAMVIPQGRYSDAR